jgi:acetyltransferase-like isoleucine patch superfamily enzyme
MFKNLQVLLSLLPKSRFGNYLRLIFWRLKLKNKSIQYIGHQANIVGVKDLILGENFTLGDFSSIEIGQSDPVWIGNDVSIARMSYLRSANHAFKNLDVPIRLQGHESKKITFQGGTYSIVIEDNVWVGANVIILSGTHLKGGNVVAAGSVLSGEYEKNTIIVGNPARIMGKR